MKQEKTISRFFSKLAVQITKHNIDNLKDNKVVFNKLSNCRTDRSKNIGKIQQYQDFENKCQSCLLVKRFCNRDSLYIERYYICKKQNFICRSQETEQYKQSDSEKCQRCAKIESKCDSKYLFKEKYNICTRAKRLCYIQEEKKLLKVGAQSTEEKCNYCAKNQKKCNKVYLFETLCFKCIKKKVKYFS